LAYWPNGTFETSNVNLLCWYFFDIISTHYDQHFAGSRSVCGSMKKYLLRSILLFVFALALSAAAFWYVSLSGEVFVGQPAEELSSEKTATTTKVMNAMSTVPVAVEPQFIIPPTGFPIRMLPLTQAHLNVLANADIDVMTLMVTPAMIECGREKIGDKRMSAMTRGEVPTLSETSKLLPCFKSN